MDKHTMNYYFKCLGIAAMLTVAATACTDGFDALNTPPDEINSSNIDVSNLGQLFAHSQFFGQSGSLTLYANAHFRQTDLWSQYLAITSPIYVQDNLVATDSNIFQRWRDTYAGRHPRFGSPTPSLKLVEDITEEQGLELQNAIAKVWKVGLYHQVTDAWGPIIYSEFGNGETSVPYDSQESVYKSFFQTLDEAVAVLGNNLGENAFGANDLIFDGDVTLWHTFANSLRLRLAVRVRYVEPALAQQEAEKAVAAGVMTDNSELAEIPTNPQRAHPLGTMSEWEEHRMSATMHSVLIGFEDPRLPALFNPAESDGEFRGLRNGLTAGERGPELNPVISNVNSKWRPGEEPPLRVMSTSEVYFLRAEGALAGWDMGGTVRELYEEGIRTSIMQHTEATPAEIDAYISSLNTPVAIDDAWDTPAMSDITVAFDEGGDPERQLEQIITQKWIAVFPDGKEAWAERRRTGYPRGYPVINSQNPRVAADELVRRLRFSTAEYDVNNAAVQEAIQLLDGPDETDTRVWWDAKPLSDFPDPGQ